MEINVLWSSISKRKLFVDHECHIDWKQSDAVNEKIKLLGQYDQRYNTLESLTVRFLLCSSKCRFDVGLIGVLLAVVWLANENPLMGPKPAHYICFTCVHIQAEEKHHQKLLTFTVLVAPIDAQWEGMGDVGPARYEPALLPPCPTIRVISYSN